MKSVLGKIAYSQTGPRNPDNGSADCSSTVNWAYKSVLGQNIGNTTDQILRSSNTETIDLANLDPVKGGQNSSGPNINRLMPGDLLLYSRPSSSGTVGRPYRVGHVEMYVGNGQRIGHGGGKSGNEYGPKITDISRDSSRYILAKRLKGITDESRTPIKSVSRVFSSGGNNYYLYGDGSSSKVSAAGSGILSYDDYTNLSAGSSGLLLKRNPSNKIYGRRSAEQSKNVYSGGASNLSSIINTLSDTIDSRSANVRSNGSSGEKLLEVLIKLLERIADKNSPTDQILTLLQQYLPNIVTSSNNAEEMSNANKLANLSAGGSGMKNNNNGVSGTINTDIDPNIKYLVGQLAAIAKG